MYTPSAFRISSIADCQQVVRENGFATVVSSAADGSLVATHIPCMLEPGPREAGTLVGHVAKANPHAALLAAGRATLAIFTGPHAYISAAAYQTPQDVPTWNYVIVHAHGIPRPMPADHVRRHLGALVSKYESDRRVPWSLDAAGEEFIAQQMRGILAFEMPIDRLEGKAKLSQNREPADRDGVLRLLRTEGGADQHAVADAMDRFRPGAPL